MSVFDIAFSKTIESEGGFTDDPDDHGNWTTGIIGKGELKGTKYGISAATFPTLDIKNLTTLDAKTIYRVSWWDINNYGRINTQAIADKAFSIAVNTSGPNLPAKQANKLLQRACWSANGYQCIKDDGVLGEISFACINACDPSALLAAFKSEIAGFYRIIANDGNRKFQNGWLKRAYA